MSRVDVSLGERSYPITIKPGLLSQAGREIAPLASGGRLAVVAQRAVWDFWGSSLGDSLRQAGIDYKLIQVPNGETAKTLAWTRRLYNAFAEAGIDRTSTVAAFGGGAVGDLAGFAAATWLRGVQFVQIPTTLLAQVDASVGGKVGVNLSAGKNLVGAFWQPRAVLIDPDTLTSLPKRELRSGLAEVIKYGIILDSDFFRFVRENQRRIAGLEHPAIEHAIEVSCRLKAEVVRSDEREAGLRAILNYGHTVGHAIESSAGYGRIRHGEAVSVGMVIAARIAVELAMLDRGAAAEIEEVVRSFGLPAEAPEWLDLGKAAAALAVDKKSKAGRVRFVLPTAIGAVEMSDQVTSEMVLRVLGESRERVSRA